ncbi:AAA family ATPase [Paenibacillus sinopodophylli]|uniref:AAA family ATPase n=1 Tax=Paenibacillus sinopodophylli TaxID=1837342 RepID=UPI00110D0695|nr:AAA family ATPase [Paenibacillus sinopodophylli]
MKFVLLFGPQAVGKMTIGHALEKVTDLKLFHNHMTLEMLSPLFGFSKEMWRLSDLFRLEIFESVAKSELEGLIFTYVWAFDQQEDWNFVDKVCRIFETQGADIYFVELAAALEERLERNKTPHRLEHKPTKRNLEKSEEDLVSSMDRYRLNSFEGEIMRETYLRIDNTHLEPSQVAQRIKDTFKL